MTTRAPHIIDLQHHILPPSYVKVVGERAIGELLVSGKTPNWTPEMSLDVMNRAGISRAYVSMSAPGIEALDDTVAEAVTKDFNDCALDLVALHPDRFGIFASLPMSDTGSAIAELHRVSEIGVAGVCLLTSYGGRLLGDPFFDPVFSELDNLSGIVFVHPDAGPGNHSQAHLPAATLNFPFQTTRAVTEMLVRGVFIRYPGIKFIFSHAGGAVPFLAGRIGRLSRIPRYKDAFKSSVQQQLATLYFDLALSANAAVISSLREIVSLKQVFFGSDFPFAPEETTFATIDALHDLPLHEEETLDICNRNAARLFGAVEGPIVTGAAS